MEKVKQYSGPGITFVLGVALQLSGWQNQSLAMVLFVIAIVWTLVATWPRQLATIRLRSPFYRSPLSGREDWLNRIAEEDKQQPSDKVFVHHIAILWRLMDRDGAYYFDFQVHVFNGSVYDLALGTKVEGNVSCDASSLMPHPEINEMPKDVIRHGEGSYVQLRQDITHQRPVVARLREKNGQPVSITFSNLKIWAEYRSPSGDLVVSFPLKLLPKVQSPPVYFYT